MTTNVPTRSSGKSSDIRYFINRQIRANQVLCIDHTGANRGVISFFDALKIAEQNELDLVQIGFPPNGQVPTVKILDFGKFKYEQSKKEKQAKKKQRESAIEVKEIKLRPSTAENDLRIKAKQAQEFLENGDKVKINVQFHGREMSHQEIGLSTLNIFISYVPNGQLANPPSLNGKDLVAILESK
jgi:translation initiation factor IF-3